MLNELVKRFGTRGPDRREAERFRKRFGMAWLRAGTLVPGMGLEISVKGILFATKEPPPGTTVDVALDLKGRRVRARLGIVRTGTMHREGGQYAVVAGVFQGIAADDWDAVARFCKDMDEPTNRAAEELAAAAQAPDDAYRLLPLKVQQHIVGALVAAHRIAPDSDAAKNPLLRMRYIGKTGQKHRLSVHSRWNHDGEMLMFDSFVTIDDDGNVTLER